MGMVARSIQGAWFLGGLAAACLAPSGAWAACKLVELAQFPLHVVDRQPLIDGEINGHKVIMLADTGAERSTILRSSAVKMKLHEAPLQGVIFYGAGGATTPTYVDLGEIKIGDLTGKNFQMRVMGESSFGDAGPVALVGADLWERGDDEIDLAHNVIRLLKPDGCTGDQVLYWAEPFSATKLLISTSAGMSYAVNVTLDGVTMRA